MKKQIARLREILAAVNKAYDSGGISRDEFLPMIPSIKTNMTDGGVIVDTKEFGRIELSIRNNKICIISNEDITSALITCLFETVEHEIYSHINEKVEINRLKRTKELKEKKLAIEEELKTLNKK